VNKNRACLDLNTSLFHEKRLFVNEIGLTHCTKRCRTYPQIFSKEALDFSEGALEESFEKVGDGTLPLGLFPSKPWKVLFFRVSDGNRCHLTHGFAADGA
jgi:hypothetical protein